MNEIEQIAVIGLAGRFPGAKSVVQFWHNLREGVESISEFTDKELENQGVPPALVNDPKYVKAKGVLEDVEMFDASFFGFIPRDSEITDPQHRVFLEVAWQALENAGCNPHAYNGAIGVYAGASKNTYEKMLFSSQGATGSVSGFQTGIGNNRDFLTSRVSYWLDLKGPSITLQTACSTSLVAIHLACESLLNYQCDMALAGGVSICFPQKVGYLYQEGMIMSQDGHCRAFDARANGIVGGEGVGIVVLKRLSEAVSDGDCIHAVIKGGAVNNDGGLKIGFTAPSEDGQAEVIAMAQAVAGVAAESISYIEAHGTGTTLGDPIEIAALTKAFRSNTQEKGFCAIGSGKTNIGHVDAAAGVAGLIKVVLMLKHKEIPPSLHFEEPNPEIDFENSPFYVNTKLKTWNHHGAPLRAGVSSFGVGGTNAHIVLEEAPVANESEKSRAWQLLLLSAKTSNALDRMTENLVENLTQHPMLNLANVAYTLQVGRKVFDHRRMVVCKDRYDALNSLKRMEPKRILTSFQAPLDREVVFMFSGQGSQYPNMGKDLYHSEAIFQKEIDRCSKILLNHLGRDLRDILYPKEKSAKNAAHDLAQTLFTQPALFIIEYALAQLWISWGIRPSAMVGHSIGEYVAACLAGVFSLEDALSLVSARGRLMQELPEGHMLAVPLAEKEIRPFLGENLSLAAVNGPSLCVVSGEKEAVENLETRLSKENIECRRLHTSHAFHSKRVESIMDLFIGQVEKVNLRPPQTPFLSNVTGMWITADEAMSPAYWGKHLRQTVRFSDCVQELLRERNRMLLEVGPGRTLCTLVRQHSNEPKEQIVLSSIRHPKEQNSDIAFILETLGRLWLAGVQVDWPGFYKDEKRHRVPLPTYPFERQPYWVESRQSDAPESVRQNVLRKKLSIEEWLYLPSWKRTLEFAPLSQKIWKEQKLSWLVFLDECGLGAQLVRQLKWQEQEVIAIKKGEKFESIGKESYTINPKAKDDYDNLIKELCTLGKVPKKIIHLWSVTLGDCLSSGIEMFSQIQEVGFYSLIFLTQALAKQNVTHTIELEVVTNHLYEVTGEEELLCPEKATILGPCKVIPQEHANIRCRNIDLNFCELEKQPIEQLLGELTASSTDVTVAYRGKHRWIQIFDQVKLDGMALKKPRLQDRGVYIVTGGQGNVGLVLAEYLAQTVQARLALISRTSLPPRSEWKHWIETHDEQDTVSRKIRRVTAIEELGAKVLLINADVANEDQMKGALAQVEERFGGINGVIHAAGIFHQASIQEVSRELCEQHFESKVNGLFILQRLLEKRSLDFCLMTSSLASVLGGLGYVSYAAANLFMDAFAHRHNKASSMRWISVNWDGWQFHDEVAQDLGISTDLTELSIKPKEGGEVFSRILSLDLGPQIVVSTGDLQGRMEKWINLQSFKKRKQTNEEVATSLLARPTLPNVYVAPANHIEQTIAKIWQELLGIEKAGIHDNFFELGGHSLLATQYISRLREDLAVEVPLRSVFENLTIAEMADLIKTYRSLKGESRTMPDVGSEDREEIEL